MGKQRLRLVATPWVIGLAACGGERDARPPAEESLDPAMSIRIVEPAEGAEVSAEGFTVRLSASGVQIVPAGTDEPRSGHHHLLIDTDTPPPGQPIPSVEGHVHLGQAQTEYQVSELGPGWHRIIALLGDAQHVPHDPPIADTVNVFVR